MNGLRTYLITDGAKEITFTDWKQFKKGVEPSKAKSNRSIQREGS